MSSKRSVVFIFLGSLLVSFLLVPSALSMEKRKKPDEPKLLPRLKRYHSSRKNFSKLLTNYTKKHSSSLGHLPRILPKYTTRNFTKYYLALSLALDEEDCAAVADLLQKQDILPVIEYVTKGKTFPRSDAFDLMNNFLEIAHRLNTPAFVEELKSQTGYTLFHTLAGLGYYDLVRLCLDKGIPATFESPEGNTPLDLAREHGPSHVIELLENFSIQEHLCRQALPHIVLILPVLNSAIN